MKKGITFDRNEAELAVCFFLFSINHVTPRRYLTASHPTHMGMMTIKIAHIDLKKGLKHQPIQKSNQTDEHGETKRRTCNERITNVMNLSNNNNKSKRKNKFDNKEPF
jgi:hypothetical protein